MAFDWGTDVGQPVEDAIGRLDDYNSGNFNAATNPRGLAGGGHITNFPAALTDTSVVANGFKTFADLMAGYASSAATSAANATSAIAALSGTSVSSVALSTGSKSFSTQSGKTWPAGTLLLISSDANPTSHWMVGQVTAYAGTSLSIDVKLFSGSGSRADWTIRAAGWPGRAGGLSYIWSTTTTASDPTSGRIKCNAAPSAATAVYISETDFDGNALSALILSWDDSTSTTKGRLAIHSVTQPGNFAVFDITAAITDNGTWDTIVVSPISSGGSIPDGAMVQVFFVPAGNAGSQGVAGPQYNATSSSSNSISTGSKTFTTQSGLAYLAGTRARIADAGNPTVNWIEGVVTSYGGTSLTLAVDNTSGSGTLTNWTISIAGERGAVGSAGAQGDDGGLEFLFNTATAGDPGVGKFLFNHATFLSATTWFVSENDNNGNNVANLLATLDNGSGTNKILVSAIKQGGTAYFSFFVTSTLTDLGAYNTFSITPIASSGTIANNDPFHIEMIPLEKGDAGSAGIAGPTTAPTWLFDAGTTAVDPGTNEFALNNAAAASATALYINETGVGASSLATFIQSWDDSTNSTHRGTLYIIQTNDSSKYAIFTTGSVTDNGTYDTVVLTYVAGPGGFTAGAACAFSFTRSGNAGAGSGDVVGPASASNNALVIFDTTTGKLVKNSLIEHTTGPNVLAPITTDNVALGSTTKMWSDLFLASGAIIDFNNGQARITNSAAVISVTTGDLQVANVGTNSASVVTVGGTQTLTGKTLTAPVINSPTGITATDVGLGNVTNTSDANKPVSTAQAAINAIAKFVTVRCATTANLTIATSPKNGDVIDGVTVATGQLVLVKNQSSAAENGIYVAGTSSPARHGEYDTYNEHAGAMVTVQEGTTLADTIWICSSNIGGTIGVTAIAFTQFVASGYTADGTTLTLAGQQFSINLNNANTWLGSQTFLNASGIKIRDTDASHTLGLVGGSNLTADRTLTLTLGDANRTLALGGDLTTGGAFTVSGSFAGTITLAGVTNVTLPTSGTLATTDAASLTSGTLPDARLSSAATPYGLQAIWIPASSCLARTTNGAAAFATELVTNDVMISGFDFDSSTAEAIQFAWAMPPSWNEGTVTFAVHWTVASGTGGVAFTLRARAASNDDAMDGTWGTAIAVTDTILTANDEHLTATSAAVTVGNTPAAGDLVFFELARDPANGSDTAAVDARVLGITLYITTDAGHD